jgi:hypothetical protein
MCNDYPAVDIKLVGRDRARCLTARLSIPPVVTVRATFTAHGDPRRGELTLVSFWPHRTVFTAFTFARVVF